MHGPFGPLTSAALGRAHGVLFEGFKHAGIPVQAASPWPSDVIRSKLKTGWKQTGYDTPKGPIGPKTTNDW